MDVDNIVFYYGLESLVGFVVSGDVTNLNRFYQVKSVDGLGPMPRQNVLAALPGRGGILQSARAQDRTVTIVLKLLPRRYAGETPSTVRDYIYRALGSAGLNPITMRLNGYQDGVYTNLDVPCHVRELTPNPYSKDPELLISVDCLDAYFEDATAKNVNDPQGTDTYVTYTGTAPANYQIAATLMSDADTAVLRNYAGKNSMTFKYPFKSGNVLVVDTDRRTRSVKIYPSVDVYKNGPILNYVSKLDAFVDGDWDVFVPGSNWLTHKSRSGSSSEVVMDVLKITYKNNYLGV